MMVAKQLQLMELVLQLINAQAIPNLTKQEERSYVNQLIAQVLQITQNMLVWMVNAMFQVHALITLKLRQLIQTDVPNKLAPEHKSSEPMVNALTVQLMKRLRLIINKDVKLTVAHKTNSIPQMLFAMTPHAQNTLNQIAKGPKNAKQRHMHVLVIKTKLWHLMGLMMAEHA